MTGLPPPADIVTDRGDEILFARIADELYSQGYSIQTKALPEALATALVSHQQSMATCLYEDAGVGRGEDYERNQRVRTDEICWITGNSDAGKQWLGWTAGLQCYLNRRLFLGLFSFESHFAHYAPGAFYQRHFDAFRGASNRVLSVVVYLNPDWQTNDGGELVLYLNDEDIQGTRIAPEMGTVVIFLSEEFPHEVLPARRDRHSIAGWFRVNTSVSGKVDPPQ